METRFTEDNIELIKKWMSYIQSGHFGNAKDIVDTYNTIFEGIKRKQNYTNCGSCLRRYVKEMYAALMQYEENNKQTEKIETDETQGSRVQVRKGKKTASDKTDN